MSPSPPHCSCTSASARDMNDSPRIQREHETFARLGRELAATTSAESAAQIILDAAGQLIGWEACYLILYDPEKGGSPRPLLTIDTTRGLRVTQRDSFPKMPSENMLRAIAEGGFISLYAGFFEMDPSQTFGDRTQRTLSQIFVPVISGTRAIGVISIQSYKRNAYQNEQLDLLRALTSHCAGALERIWAQEALVGFAERLKTLHSAVNEINANLDAERVCRVVYEAVRQVMPCDDFVINGYDRRANEVIPIYTIEFPGRRIQAARYFADHGLSGEVFRARKPILFNSREEMEASGIQFVMYGSNVNGDDYPTRSILAAPMLLRGEVYGMISAQSYQPGAYDQEDLYLLETLASHAAIAIENARLFDSVQHLANTDPLTGALNRRRFFELAEQEFVKAQEGGAPFSVILLDVDDFKQFNDRHGHKAGDAALLFAAETCKSSLRTDDIFCRLGGEEFVAALPNTFPGDARDVAERLRCAIQDASLSAVVGLRPDPPPAVTVSVGVANYEPSCNSLDALIERADQAMYEAKNTGRNQVREWGEMKGNISPPL